MDLTAYLKLMADKGASDLYLSTGAPVMMKVEGHTAPITQKHLPAGAVKELAYSIMKDKQRAEFEKSLELDMAVGLANIGRFRVNVLWQRGEVSMVIRHLKTEIPSIDTLGLPKILEQLIMEPRGLILVVGSTGSGKSTTLASMLDYRNSHTTGHILTIEDPIEYTHTHQKSVVNQREVGVDTHSYTEALRRAMREAPDVIMIGEIRDRETMKQALTYAETGHLCISTLHASNVDQTMRRIVNFFPEHAHKELFMDLSLHLKAVVAQRLLKGKDGKRCAAVEVMLASPYIKDIINKGEVEGITEVMEKSQQQGMKTFDQAIMDLYHQGKITEDTALANADSRHNLEVKIRLEKGSLAGNSDSLTFDRD
ncbi:type IV pili twitching motility protein PilT [Marinobacter vinifirmus]|uniref:Type IV pili twitching motility protein PilT n=1 Tax=Marinobacter vinifirmus TaxID=355591 RepID=A0A7Z1IN55_9GAMM|nr:PilT/PilU family type 4a pilus ATPase [Marinobacter vinifirmus]OZC37000.1 type IV pili twitching motility protein PilT [Marinobacter vinifirmus]